MTSRPARPKTPQGRAVPRCAATRRRGESLEQAILLAAWDELEAVGYTNVTMDGVARRAGTSKPVLYRRWPSRAELIVAALRQRVGSISDKVPDTGNLRDDVLALLRHASDRYRDLGPEVLQGLLGELNELLEPFGVMHEAMMTILHRAAERGEASLDKVTPRIASLPVDLVRHELLVTHATVSEAALEEIVDEIFLPLVRP